MRRRGRNDAPKVLNDGLINGDAAELLNGESERSSIDATASRCSKAAMMHQRCLMMD